MQAHTIDTDTSNIRRDTDGTLYYTHPAGVVFSDRLRAIRTAEGEDRPFVLRFATGIPESATRWTPEQGTAEAQFVETWIEECDAWLETMAAAVRWLNDARARAVATPVCTVFEIPGGAPAPSTPPGVAAVA